MMDKGLGHAIDLILQSIFVIGFISGGITAYILWKDLQRRWNKEGKKINQINIKTVKSMKPDEQRIKELSQKYPHLHPIIKEDESRLPLGYLITIDLDAIEVIAKGENMTPIALIDNLMIK